MAGEDSRDPLDGPLSSLDGIPWVVEIVGDVVAFVLNSQKRQKRTESSFHLSSNGSPHSTKIGCC